MKVLIGAEGSNLTSHIRKRLGYSAYYLIANTETMKVKSYQNSFSGDPVKILELVDTNKIDAVITSNIGPDGFKTFKAKGIKIYISRAIKVRDAIEKLKNGELTETKKATAKRMPQRKIHDYDHEHREEKHQYVFQHHGRGA